MVRQLDYPSNMKVSCLLVDYPKPRDLKLKFAALHVIKLEVERSSSRKAPFTGAPSVRVLDIPLPHSKLKAVKSG